MAFSANTIKLLKSNPILRRELFQAKKLGIKAGLTPTPEATAKLADFNLRENTAFHSLEGQMRFQQFVKPELQPAYLKEDLFNKGYMQEIRGAFWKDPHNKFAYALAKKKDASFLIRDLSQRDGTHHLVDIMKHPNNPNMRYDYKTRNYCQQNYSGEFVHDTHKGYGVAVNPETGKTYTYTELKD